MTTDCATTPQEGNHHRHQDGRDMADPPEREVGFGVEASHKNTSNQVTSVGQGEKLVELRKGMEKEIL